MEIHIMIYHFTNDTRFDDLEENLYSIANYLENGIWENSKQSYKQADNGWLHVYTLYFGLYEGSKNTKAILQGKTEFVITEFVKKLQFPNPRKIKKADVMVQQFMEGQKIAPLREIIKLLFYKGLVEKNNQPKISVIDFKRHILLNENLGKGQVSIADVYTSLENEGVDSELPTYDYYGGDEKRFITQLIGIMTKLDFILLAKNEQSSQEELVLNMGNLSPESKQHLLDIVSYNDYWKDIESIDTEKPDYKKLMSMYKEYMQIESDIELESKDNADLEPNDEEQSSKKYEMDSKFYNIIYYGAPGTGKSQSISKKIMKNYPDFENEECLDVFRTTLHPEFTYTDFVGQVMPVINDDKEVTYKFSPGVFTLALKRALEVGKDRPVYLVLEELSRANVAAVFGDLFQLLDRKNGQSEYKISNPLIAKNIYNLTDQDVEKGASVKIYLPQNLYIYATVNTNDQNVFAMDTAFKRRFDWEYISTNPVNGENNPILKVYDGELEYSVSWHLFYIALNDYITREMALSEDKQIGQFFINFVESEETNKKLIKNKLLQYLWDDVEKATFNGEKLFNEKIKSFAELYTSFEDNKRIFNDEFLNKLKGTISSSEYSDVEIVESIDMEEQNEED